MDVEQECKICEQWNKFFSVKSRLVTESSMPGQDPGAGTSVTLANESQDAQLSIDDVTTSDVMP